jgi:hypothetical protein
MSETKFHTHTEQQAKLSSWLFVVLRHFQEAPYSYIWIIVCNATDEGHM